MKIQEALQELRKEKKRKFIQTVDLIINLQKFDVRTETVNTFIQLPYPSDKRVCAFLGKRASFCDTITKDDFDHYKDLKEIKSLEKRYDFFIASAQLMPLVATKFGRILGPVGKMPSPQAGIIGIETDENVKAMIEKMKKLVRVKSKEKSLKIVIGKENLTDSEIEKNAEAVLSSIKNILPKKNENIKNVMIKFTMTKSIKLD